MSAHPSAMRPWPDCPLVVAYGLGVDSTAMLVDFVRRGVRPELICLPTPAVRSPRPTSTSTSFSHSLAATALPPS